MATTPNFSATPKVGVATVSAANTSFDGSGTMSTVITGGTNGTRVDMIVIAATATTTAGLVNLFISDTTGANTTANTHHIRANTIAAVTPSVTTAPANVTLTSQTNPEFLPLFIPAGYTLRAAPTQANSFRVMAIGGDF
ncbi:MAG: hypothetical protein EBU31_00495 [Proteobacteria bacterium]|nr:hypothetical protein [Pseudomonadota bacterium]